jgi:predicted metalloendopeptidase
VQLQCAGNTDLKHMFGAEFYVGMPTYMDWLDQAFVDNDERTLRNWVIYHFVDALAAYLPSMREVYIQSNMQTHTRRRTKGAN